MVTYVQGSLVTTMRTNLPQNQGSGTSREVSWVEEPPPSQMTPPSLVFYAMTHKADILLLAGVGSITFPLQLNRVLL